MEECTRMGSAAPRPARRRGRRVPRRRALPDGVGAQWLAEALWHAPVGVAVLDAGLRYRSINPALAALNGLPEQAHLGRTVEEVLPFLPADVLGAMRRAIATGLPRHHIQASGTDAAGAARHVEAAFYPVRGARGRVTGLVAVVRDETARRAVEESERAARRWAETAALRLARLQQATAALSAAITSEEVAEAIFEVALDALGAAGGSLSFPAGRDLVQVAHTSGFFEEGQPPRAHPVSLRLPLAEAFTRLEPVWIESAADLTARYPRLVELGHAVTEGAFAAVPLLVRGRPLGVLGLHFAGPRRFSEDDRSFALALARECAQAIERARLLEEQRQLRAQAEAAAAERERLVKDLRRTLRERDESAAVLDALFGNAPVGLALLDRGMRLERVNKSLADMNGLPVMRHLGRSVAEILPELPLEPIARAFRHTLETLEPVIDLEIEGETPAAPGERRHWLHSLYPVAVGGQVIGVGALVREVTAQKRAAEFQRQLLGVVGHDLRSPLLAITSSAAMLQHAESLSERAGRAVGRILSAATRMDGIVRALADYTRVQVGRGIPLEIRPGDLRAICREVIDELQAARPGRVVSCRASGCQRGEWDPDRIGQVVANLVGNALDFSPPESPVAVVCRGEPDAVLLEVHNQGDPIPPEFRPHLFEPFRRGPGADRKNGLGLGLFIARQIVLAHGGSIDVDSRAAEGTAFTVRLPRRVTPRD